MAAELRRAERRRYAQRVTCHLAAFPRRYDALESAMAAFGEGFELASFKCAFTTEEDMVAYNRVQAVERAAGRVQNYIAELADAGIRLAGLERPPMNQGGSVAVGSFEALRDKGVIDAGLCRRLIRSQKARARIEHSYVDIPADDVHRAVELIHEAPPTSSAGIAAGSLRICLGGREVAVALTPAWHRRSRGSARRRLGGRR